MAKLRPEDLPNISSAAIDDKSKASLVTQCLLILQLIKFCVFLLLRWVKGHHVPLLEGTIAIHALFDLMENLLWWKKPFDLITMGHDGLWSVLGKEGGLVTGTPGRVDASGSKVVVSSPE
jgi:hypothetical protein